MWQTFSLHEHVAAFCFSDGWSIMIHRMPGSADKKVYLTVNRPEHASFALDSARPPYLYADDAELNLGDALSLQLTMLRLNSDADHYEAFDDRLSMAIWHGNLSEGIGKQMIQIGNATDLRLDVFVVPRSIITIHFPADGLRASIETAFGVRLRKGD